MKRRAAAAESLPDDLSLPAEMLILACDCVQAANDKQQITPMLEPLKALPQQIGQEQDTPIQLAADTGDFSEHNVRACVAAQITPLIAQKRDWK